MTPLQLALTSESEMNNYRTKTTNLEMIRDIKNHSNADRTVIATAALSGLCAVNNKGSFSTLEEAHEVLADQSVLLADALIKSLKK